MDLMDQGAPMGQAGLMDQGAPEDLEVPAVPNSLGGLQNPCHRPLLALLAAPLSVPALHYNYLPGAQVVLMVQVGPVDLVGQGVPMDRMDHWVPMGLVVHTGLVAQTVPVGLVGLEDLEDHQGQVCLVLHMDLVDL